MKFSILILLSIIIVFSCNKNNKNKEDFKDEVYRINKIINNKEYENAIKYIDSIYFSKEKNLTNEDKATLLFKGAEIKYLYLNSTQVAYKEMKKLFKNKNLNKKLYIKLLRYLVEISETIDYQNFGIFLLKLNELDSNKELLYRMIDFYKKEGAFKKIEDIINKKSIILSKDEKMLIELELLILKKSNKEKILGFIDSSMKKTKSQDVKDELNVKKIFYLEQQENIEYKELLSILKLIKSKKYNKLIKSKEKFYNEKISLYNKK
jgi:hypothetical protein